MIDTDTARIRQYDKRRMKVLSIILPLKISVIGSTYRYLGNRHLDADFAVVSAGTAGAKTEQYEVF